MSCQVKGSGLLRDLRGRSRLSPKPYRINACPQGGAVGWTENFKSWIQVGIRLLEVNL